MHSSVDGYLVSFHVLATVIVLLWTCCCSFVKSCLTFWDPMYCSTPCFPVLPHLLQFAQTHVHQSVQFSCSVVSNSLWPHELQHARPPSPSPTPRVNPNSFPSSRDTIQPSHSLSSPSPPAPNPSQHQGLFQWGNSLHEVAKVLEFQL